MLVGGEKGKWSETDILDTALEVGCGGTCLKFQHSEAETEGSQTQGQAGLHSKFQASLGYKVRGCVSKEKQQKDTAALAKV